MRLPVQMCRYGAAAAAILLTGAAGAAEIATYPIRPIRLVVGQEAGSALDNSVRILTAGLG